MGHVIAKDIYKKLGKKIDTMPTRSPRNETLYKILKELYTEEEAFVVAWMPYGLANLDRISKITKFEKNKLRKVLECLAGKGLVMDIFVQEEYYYMPQPMVIGIFEFTMMRTRGELNYKKWSELFHRYLHEEGDIYQANFNKGQKVSLMRSIPYEESIDESEFTEVLDHEKANAIIENSDIMAVGLCSCRHEKLHCGLKTCDTPLDTCSTFGYAADYWIRNDLAKKASKSEMLENVARSKEMGLVICGDNIKNNVLFMCHLLRLLL